MFAGLDDTEEEEEHTDETTQYFELDMGKDDVSADRGAAHDDRLLQEEDQKQLAEASEQTVTEQNADRDGTLLFSQFSCCVHSLPIPCELCVATLTCG